jgi:hypothetical protein
VCSEVVPGNSSNTKWVWSNGILTAQEICEEQETEINLSPRVVVGDYATQTREFKNFLSSLKKNL